MDTATQIQKLWDMKESGILSADEFVTAKQRVLSAGPPAAAPVVAPAPAAALYGYSHDTAWTETENSHVSSLQATEENLEFSDRQLHRVTDTASSTKAGFGVSKGGGISFGVMHTEATHEETYERVIKVVLVRRGVDPNLMPAVISQISMLLQLTLPKVPPEQRLNAIRAIVEPVMTQLPVFANAALITDEMVKALAGASPVHAGHAPITTNLVLTC